MPVDGTDEAKASSARAGNGLLIGLAVAALLLTALDLVYERHPHFEIEGWTGFYALCGAAAFTVGIAGALLLRSVATRPEDEDDR